VLVPALALVVIALAAIAVDLSAVHAAHRSLHRSVSAAADDAAGMLDQRHLQLTGEVRIDAAAAQRVAAAHLASASLPGELVDLRTDVDPAAGTVTVTATVVVRRILLPASASTGRDESLHARVRARVRL
jgi:hypothetical protein